MKKCFVNKSSGILFFLLFLFFTDILYAQRLDIISTGDPVLEDIRYLSLEAGIPFLSFTPPFSPHELKNFLSFIDSDNLSQAGVNAYNRINSRIARELPPISWSDELFAVSFNANAVFESNFRFNNNISWDGDLSNVSPILSFPIQFFFSEYIQMYIEPNIAVKSRSYGNDSFHTNIPDNFSSQYWPFRSFTSIGGSWWNFIIGKDHLYWGSGHTGSLVFSNDSTYHDFAKLSFFTRYFKYSFIINHLPLFLDKNMIDNFDEISANDKKSIDRYFYLHRIDVNILNKISFSIMEGTMVGNSPLEIRYFNPLAIYHSFYAWKEYDRWNRKEGDNKDNGYMVGAFLSLEVNWNIVKPLSVYGQFVMNEVSIQSEKDKLSELPPDCLGYLAGINFSHPINSWNSFYFLEFIYTEPYAYILSSPFASFIQQDYHYYLLGHSRDTISLTAGAKFFIDTLSFSGSFSWISSGEHNSDYLKWDWERGEQAYNEKSPSGIAENKFKLSFETEWKPLSWLYLKAGITGIISLNNKHINDNTETGGQASLSAGIKY